MLLNPFVSALDFILVLSNLFLGILIVNTFPILLIFLPQNPAPFTEAGHWRGLRNL